jgi:SchA/CurD like domain
MSNWHAVLYPIKKGAERQVGELFQQARITDTAIRDSDGAEVGKLLGTMVFVGPGRVLRVIEFDGTLPQLITHLRSQRGTGDFQRSLNEFLDLPGQPSGPGHVAGFFRDAALECVLERRHDQPVR